MHPPGSLEFWNVAIALSKTEKSIRNLELRACVPTATFDTESMAFERRLILGGSAFAGLKELRLKLNFGYDDAGVLVSYDKLNGLRILLDRIRGLEVLDLCLPTDHFTGSYSRDDWVHYDSIFPKNGAWPHIREFAIGDLAIQGRHLIHLLFVRMPDLQHLKLSNLNLLDGGDGIWKSVIEALKFRRLSSIGIYPDVYLYDGPDFNFLSTDSDDRGFFEKFERYVVHGMHDWTLRHPCLPDSQPTQDSLDNLCGILDGANKIAHTTNISISQN